jgi:hypothetical protein
MQETDLHYPAETCPFCSIAAAFPYPQDQSQLWKSNKEELEESMPTDEEANPEKTSPSSFVVLRSRDVLAFLDILPMTGGEYDLSILEVRVGCAWQKRSQGMEGL